MRAFDGGREAVGGDPLGLRPDDVHRRPVGTDDRRDALQLPSVRVGERQRGDGVDLACGRRPDGVGARGRDRRRNGRSRHVEFGCLRCRRHAGRQLRERHLARHGLLHLAVRIDVGSYEPTGRRSGGRRDRSRIVQRRYELPVQVVAHGDAVVGG